MVPTVASAAAAPNDRAVPRTCPSRSQRGVALLVVLVILLVVGGSSASFIWFMNQQQSRAGTRYRSALAMTVAEAGIHQALSFLEGLAPDGGPGRAWRPTAYTESMPVGPLEGRFTLSLIDDAGGAVVVTSLGEVAGTVRRLRARVYLAPPALLVALNGASFIRLEKPPTATLLLPYGAGIGNRPWIHMAAERGIWLATSDVSINDSSADFGVGPGPLDAPAGAGSAPTPPRPMRVRLALARGAELMLDPGHQRVDVQQLRAVGAHVEVVLRSDGLQQMPEVDRPFYQALAAGNTSNADLNSAAGRVAGDRDLEHKLDSLYSQTEFNQVQMYLKAGLLPPRLTGIVYVRGRVAMDEGQRMQIADGALVTEGTVYISQGSSLEITHSAATRTLPGILVLDEGALVVTHGAQLRVHGLVYVNRVIEIGEGTHVDIIGGVLGNDRRMSFRNSGGIVVIRYDPAVLGTPGLRVAIDAPVVAWVSAWEELP